MKFQRIAGVVVVSLLAACSSQPKVATYAGGTATGSTSASTLDDVGTAYAKLVLALGEHDADYVDAFYGPAEWRDDAKRRAATLPQIEAEAKALVDVVDRATITDATPTSELIELRRRYLKVQLGALAVRTQMLEGKKLSFDDEARQLYDTEAPHYTEADFEPALKRIAALLPKEPKKSTATLSERYNRYLDRFSVPENKLEPVMLLAIAEARTRTYAHFPLPDGERFDLALVKDKPWSAYNWYQGKFVSRIEVNTSLPVPASRIIDLAAHEGYPGHHVYNGLLELNLVDMLHWPEYQVYALFSPQSLIAEGTADYGVNLAFPGDDKLNFLKVLFKRAGLDPKLAGNYLEVVTESRELSRAGIEAARRYLDGTASADETVAWLEKYTLASPERAKQRIAFFDKYRAYVINYSWGEEIIRSYITTHGGAKAQWRNYFSLLSTPRTPSGLVAAPKAE